MLMLWVRCEAARQAFLPEGHQVPTTMRLAGRLYFFMWSMP